MMKINGQPLISPKLHAFTLPRADGSQVAFRLQPLPLGFHQRLRNWGILPPTAPIKVARDSNGKPIRDANGQAVTISDHQNADYVTELERYHQRVAILSVVEALAADPEITFDTPRPAMSATDAREWTQFADAVFEELQQSGFTAGDLVLFCQEICRISNLLDEQLAVAQANFSSQRHGMST